MFKTKVTIMNYVEPEGDLPTRILAFVGTLQDAGKTDGVVVRSTTGENDENFVIEREFVDQASAKLYEDFLHQVYETSEYLVETTEIV